MGMIEEVATYVAAGSGGTLGTSLFINVMPDDSTGVATALYEAFGLPALERMGSTKPAVEKPRVVVITRSTGPSGGSGIASSTAARARINTVYRRLREVFNTNLPTSTGAYYLRIEAVHPPFLLGRDERGRVQFQFTAQIERAGT